MNKRFTWNAQISTKDLEMNFSQWKGVITITTPVHHNSSACPDLQTKTSGNIFYDIK